MSYLIHSTNKVRTMKVKLTTFIILLCLLIFSNYSGLELRQINAEETNEYSKSLKWSTAEVISLSSDLSVSSALAVDSHYNVHIVWFDSNAASNVFYRFWNSTSLEWSEVSVVTVDITGQSFYPDVIVDKNNNIHFAWQSNSNFLDSGSDADIFYSYINSTTGIWSDIELISTESSQTSTHSKLATDGKGNIHVVWADTSNYNDAGTDRDVFYKYRNAVDNEWSITEVVSVNSTENSIGALIVDIYDNVHVAWADGTNFLDSGTDIDIFHRILDNTTKSWGDLYLVSIDDALDMWMPSIASDVFGNVHVIWTDFSNESGNVAYNFWNASTSAWGQPELVSSDTEDTTSSGGDIAVDQYGNAHVVWSDSLNIYNAGADFDIFYKLRNVHTQVWETTQIITYESTSNSFGPIIVVDDRDIIHVVWEDDTNYRGSGADRDTLYKIGFDLENKYITTTQIETETEKETETETDFQTKVETDTQISVTTDLVTETLNTTFTDTVNHTITEYENQTKVETVTEAFGGTLNAQFLLSTIWLAPLMFIRRIKKL
jgi:ribosomal protein L31